MDRPYVICHIMSSLDGRINGPFMRTEAARRLSGEYVKIRTETGADAWLYGKATTREFVGLLEAEQKETGEIPKGDFIADAHAELYYISVDTEGEIGWESGTFCHRGGRQAHVIEILTDAASMAYRGYLRERGVSYILAGQTRLDCKLAMRKLYELFHIEKVLICGGGIVNWSFLQAGMVDELGLLLCPVTDGSSGTASLFTQIADMTAGNPVEFELKTARQTEDGGLYLNYLAKNTESSL